MKLIGAAAGIFMCATTLAAAQEIKTTTKEKTTFKVEEGRDLKVTGCVQRFEDAGYMLTDTTGNLKFVLVTDDNLSKYVGHLVDVKGLGTDGADGKIKIEKEVGTSGQVGGEKEPDRHSKKTTEVSGDVGFPYLGMRSIKKLSNACR